MRDYRTFINGQFIPSSSANHIEVTNPLPTRLSVPSRAATTRMWKRPSQQPNRHNVTGPNVPPSNAPVRAGLRDAGDKVRHRFKRK